MVEALDPAAYVYEGVWTNWSKGRVHGLTWTLCPTQATLLTNSLAVFVTIAGGQLWTIIRFTLHQWRASRRAIDNDDFEFHQQIILRNAATDLHTMRLMAQLAWTCRQHASRALSYTVSIASLAVIHYALFLTAGTLSNNLVNAGSGEAFSKLANGSSAVLSRSIHCGFWDPTYYDEIVTNGFINTASHETVKLSVEYNAKIDHSVQLSLEYAQECYESSPRYYMSSKCDTLPTSRLEFNRTQGSCPFDAELCHDQSNAVVFETGFIDSHKHLGINAPLADRLFYRRRTTCSVLNDTQRVVESDLGTSEATAQAYYGTSVAFGSDYTYSSSNFSSLYTEFTAPITNPYQLDTQVAYGSSIQSDGFSTFEPIQGLRQKSADIMLFFLSFNGRYFEPIQDPWFSASVLHAVDAKAPIARQQYSPDSMISTLGCSEQHQFCNPNGGCTQLLGWGQAQGNDSFNGALTDHQAVIFDRLNRATFSSSIAQIVFSLASTKTPLLATDVVAAKNTVMSLKLPENQWQLELDFWHSIAMAQFQRTMVQWATGQIAPDPQKQLDRPKKNTADSWFCNNLMIPSTVYQSFSVLWLTLIVAAGTFVILVSWTVEDVSGWVHMRSSRGAALRQVWDEHHMLRIKELQPRRSWRPSLPPKDASMYTKPPFRQYNKMDLTQPPPAHTDYKVTGALAQGSDFSWFRASQLQAHAFDQQQNPASPEIPVSTPRLWSQLPPEPSRDSWVEMDLNDPTSFTEQYMLRSVLKRDIHRRDGTMPSRAPSHSTRTIELSDLRAHALARNRDGRC